MDSTFVMTHKRMIQALGGLLVVAPEDGEILSPMIERMARRELGGDRAQMRNPVRWGYSRNPCAMVLVEKD